MEAKLKILTKQYDEVGNIDTIEVNTIGKMFEKNKDIYIVYEESEENQKVTRGEIIAKSGTSKITTENYNLHFEFMKDGKPELKILDPLYVYGEDGNYTEELKAIYANEDIGEK